MRRGSDPSMSSWDPYRNRTGKTETSNLDPLKWATLEGIKGQGGQTEAVGSEILISLLNTQSFILNWLTQIEYRPRLE